MKTLVLLLLVPFLMNGQETQTSEIVNPKGKWFFGAEVGPNIIKTFSLGEKNTFVQGGVLVEYYLFKHWSLIGRVKYFKTGMSFYQTESNSGGFFSFTNKLEKPRYGKYVGEVITIPINIKWEFRIRKNLSGQFNIGANYNYETKSNYEYSEYIGQSYERKYLSLNVGYGINYFISKKSAVFFNFETYQGGGNKGYNVSANSNSLLNFGYKYSFKN